MSGSEIIMAVFRDLAIQIPSILAIVICSILAIVRWKRHPRISLLVLIGLLLLFIHEFAFALIYATVPDLIIKSATEMNRETLTRNVYIGLAVIYNCLEVLPFVLLLIAIFMGRRKTAATVA
jgi:hypothetical protein